MPAVLDHRPHVTLAVPGIHRVEVDGETVGYIVEAGVIFVTLQGSVYNTSCEIGQSLDLDTAVHLLLR
jgi:hypothetical protein